MSRSHHGCTRCKHRRQKCDESKPSCGRCTSAKACCTYSVTLKWEGRVPRRPQDGLRVSTLLPISDNNSDYNSLSVIERAVQPLATAHHIDTGNIRLLNWCTLTSLSASHRLLLHHFVTQTSKISSHHCIRDQICQQILPMTIQVRSLLYATMALSALHRTALLHEPSEHFILEPMVAELVFKSLRSLRLELEDPTIPRISLLHTIRTLCHCEIYSGKADQSWRIHVNGARSVFDSIGHRQNWSESDGAHSIWTRWFLSIQALASVTYPRRLESLFHYRPNGQVFFDVYAGYSSDLGEIIGRIGALALKRLESGHKLTQDYGLSGAGLDLQASGIERMLHAMIHRDLQDGLTPLVDMQLSIEDIRQFAACNTAYQYSTLIVLYRRVQGLKPCSRQVQSCVTRILDAVQSILPVVSLSPWALLTTPIYTAGLEAFGRDRTTITTMLLDMYQVFRIPNILRGIQILKEHWAKVDCEDVAVTFDARVFDHVVGAGDERFLDFIPY